MKKTLAFFGAFNPPTLAHLNLARFALERTGAEQVLFVPSKSVYIRDGQGKDFAYSDARRLEMLRAAARTRPWMAVTDWEIRQERQPRTYETLCSLRKAGTETALLLGSDKLAELEHGWLHVREIAEEFGIVCLARGGDDCERMIRESAFLQEIAPGVRVLETPAETRDISSTRVRALVRGLPETEKDIAEMVPAEIMAMLRPESEELNTGRFGRAIMKEERTEKTEKRRREKR